MNEVIELARYRVRQETEESIADSVRDMTYFNFCLRRKDMIDAFRDWLAEEPSADDVAIEVDGTANMLRLLVDVLPNPLGAA